MNPYQWARLHPDTESASRQPNATATRTMGWNDAQVEMIFETLSIEGNCLVAFRPMGAPLERALVVGSAPDDHYENAIYPDPDLLEAWKYYEFRCDSWLDESLERISQGLFGRLELEAPDAKDPLSACIATFYGATGLTSVESYTRRNITIGMVMIGPPSEFGRADYDPKPGALAWSEPSEAPARLAALDDAQFAQWLEREAADEASAWGFARAWQNFSLAERRSWLSPLELEIEAEVTRLMQWAFWSDPAFLAPHPPLMAKRFPWLWRRPRFCVRPDADFGYGFLHSRFQTPQHRAQLERAQARLQAIWNYVERAFAPQIAELQTHAALPPCLRDWCHFRGAYLAPLSAPTAHQKIESRAALRDWLRSRIGADLDAIERAL